ncbi:MAG: 4-alpha-glucanotransferase [Candidatus Euphemobacter frigidus]|nr:4-alpha-glucanotransferase [Candidatus Euphemobacter frigidus]MDP8276067.1 4-alpha-glucanotransferase [Candidatus Euphemobacter frigidus]
MRFPRRSGVLLHITSLPSPYGIGDLGEGAYRFVDFLEASGQKLWQILPLDPVGFENSPYSNLSAFAGNSLLISPGELVREGLLSPGDLPASGGFSSDQIDYGQVAALKGELLVLARKRFLADAGEKEKKKFESFCLENSFWLDDFALFAALKTYYQGSPWYTWPSPIAFRGASAIRRSCHQLADLIEAARFRQFLFSRQWGKLREYANRKGVRLIGDIPIFVNQDSVDVWAHREFFLLDKKGWRTALSGVPPSRSGVSQIWDMPLYNWKVMKKNGFGWWRSRFAAVLKEVDIIRVDHFSGFYACWHIKVGAKTSAEGRWVRGPGVRLFRKIEEDLGALPIIAEALEPVIKKKVNKLLDLLGYPGIRIFQHGFYGRPDNPHLPKEYPEECVAYTGTHDDNPIIGWFTSLDSKMKKHVLSYLKVANSREINWKIISAVQHSSADTVIIQLQDVLGLGSESRMNTPGTDSGQWKWRFQAELITDKVKKKLLKFTRSSGR